MNMKERFEEKFVPVTESGCWIWIAASHERGYGHFCTTKEFSNRKMDYAHRVSWYLYKGEKPPDDLSVCHKCDNPSCVNPDHLFLGTHKDNMTDMSRKGRCVSPRLKVTEKMIEEIIRLRGGGWQVKRIAKKFNLTNSHCSRLSRGLGRKEVK